MDQQDDSLSPAEQASHDHQAQQAWDPVEDPFAPIPDAGQVSSSVAAALQGKAPEEQPAAPDPAQPAAGPQAPPKTVFHLEEDKFGDGKLVRPHRRFYGKPPKGLKLDKVEVEFDSQADPADCQLFRVPPGQNDIPGEASSDRQPDGSFYTFRPAQYGDDAARAAQGKLPLQPMSWEEWNYVEDPQPAPAGQGSP